METFLAYGFAVAVIAAAWGWRVAWQQSELAKDRLRERISSSVSWAKEMELHIEEKNAAIRQRDNLIERISERAGTFGPINPPANRAHRGVGYAGIRKAVEQQNRQDAELEEQRALNTAFVE